MRSSVIYKINMELAVLLVLIVAADGAPAVDRDHPKSQVCQYQVTRIGQSWI